MIWFMIIKVLANLNLKSFEAMRMRETFQQIYQAPDMQTFKTLRRLSLTPLIKAGDISQLMALTCSFLPFCCSSVSTKSLTV
jgi:hypothetical protein